MFAYPSCSNSVLFDVSAVPLPAPDAEEMMWLTPFVASQGATVMAALVAEVAARMYRVPGPGESGDAVNLIVAVLLGKGFTLVSRLRQPLRQLPGWTATVTGDGDTAQMTIIDKTSDLFYQGGAMLPHGWLDAAHKTGWCAMYGGAVQMPDRGTPQAGITALRDAMAAGGLVGARVAVHHAD